MNDKQTQQIQCWIEDNYADINSSDLFEQAKAYDLGIGVKEDKHKAASLYREAMNQGNKKAKHNLAMLLVTEEGDLSDKPTGIQMLQELANEGESASIYSLGGCYMNGKGVTQNIDKGLELYHTASNMGLGIATYSIAAYHFNECHDIETGMTYCEKAAELGDAQCQLKYGVLLSRTDWSQGVELMIKSANQKNPAALLIVGQEYLNSESPLFADPQHFNKGVMMLREAADSGVKEASETLVHYGLEREQRLDERMAWFYNILDNADRDSAQRAFQQLYACSEIGDPIAQCIIGVGYYYGTFVEQDKEKGMMLLKKACDCDCTDALNTIGMVLNEEKRYEESFPYHERSAEKGDMYGLHNLGNAYFYARGVERDVKKAFDLWSEASDKGNPDSHYTIGNIFFRGEYVEQDIPLAIKCYTFAASHSCTTQRMAMEQLVKVYQMTGDEKEADEWNAKLNEIE